MARETWVQSQVASYQRFLKWYLIPPCLTLSNIRYVSRVKWSNPGKGVAPSPTPQCNSDWKGSLLVALDYGRQLTYKEPQDRQLCLWCICSFSIFWWGVACYLSEFPTLLIATQNWICEKKSIFRQTLIWDRICPDPLFAVLPKQTRTRTCLCCMPKGNNLSLEIIVICSADIFFIFYCLPQ